MLRALLPPSRATPVGPCRRLGPIPFLLMALGGCWPVGLTCDVCGEQEQFLDCEQLYCRAMTEASLCGARDLERCFSSQGCPSPPVMFCPVDNSPP